ncbi:MAG: glycosyltransferase family 2 protein [Candidatus Accumulibacter meliphilus]|jgi:glycosyltransferase involved in cell wall biosynthesis|uniref:glycosyltransferase family 2 protein n=1 Tax=Candidatus Accumulibacter meliphilus TaxID=2211374 RepID=UPI002FC2D1E9
MNRPAPKISLVTCSFEQARFLDAAMRSVLNQAYPNLEYIVMDGGSKDGSREIIARHSDRLEYWVSEPDEGQTDALVRGFGRASGDIFGWLCSDDLLLPGALDLIGGYFQDHPDVAAVYGNCIWIDANGQPIRVKREMMFDRFVFLHDHNFVPQPSMFWRRALYEAVGGLDIDFNLAMDGDLWDRFASCTRIAHLPYYLSCMRYYPEQKTRSMQARGREEDLLIRRRSSRLARLDRLQPALRVMARLKRFISKAAAGGYTARVPKDILPWLEAHATPGS